MVEEVEKEADFAVGYLLHVTICHQESTGQFAGRV